MVLIKKFRKLFCVLHSARVLLGGQERVCLLDAETELVPGTLRATGDLVHRDVSGHIYYDGRLDNVVKRHGMRMNPGELQQVEGTTFYFHHFSLIVSSSLAWIISLK